MVVLFFVLPLGLLLGLYAIIWQHLAQESQGKSWRECRKPGQRFHAARKQVIYMLAAIIALFFVCILPIRVVTLWLVFSSTEDIHTLGLEGFLNVMWFARLMLYINSVGNPILYNIVSTKFREACRRLVGLRFGLRFVMRRESSYTSMAGRTSYMSKTVTSMSEQEANFRIKSVKLMPLSENVSTPTVTGNGVGGVKQHGTLM